MFSSLSVFRSVTADRGADLLLWMETLSCCYDRNFPEFKKTCSLCLWSCVADQWCWLNSVLVQRVCVKHNSSGRCARTWYFWISIQANITNTLLLLNLTELERVASSIKIESIKNDMNNLPHDMRHQSLKLRSLSHCLNCAAAAKQLQCV